MRNGGADALTRTATAPAQETAGADAGGLGGGRPPGTESRGCGGIPAGSPSVAAGPPGSLRPGAEERRRHEPPLSPVPRTAGAAPRGYALHPNFFFFFSLREDFRNKKPKLPREALRGRAYLLGGSPSRSPYRHGPVRGRRAAGGPPPRRQWKLRGRRGPPV